MPTGFVRINNTGGAVDVWAVDGIELDQLQNSPEGFRYFPGKIAPQQITLIRLDLQHGFTDHRRNTTRSSPCRGSRS
jgi:hypothetical protein